MAIQYVDDDFVKVKVPSSRPDGKDWTVILSFGDAVEVLGEDDDGKTRLRVHGYFDGPFEGTVRKAPKVRDKGVLKFSMVDVQQGDGLVLETPEGKIVLIDGGDNKLFARHVAARFHHRRSSADNPLEVDAILITHGDADHFEGLSEFRKSETDKSLADRKRLFLHPKRVFHNGLVKAPSRFKEEDRLGRSVEQDGRLYAIDLYDDPRDSPPEKRNSPFERWFETLDHWSERGPIACHRVDAGMDPEALFDFLAEEDIHLDLHGPFTEPVAHPETGEEVPGLRFFGTPKKSAEIHLEQGGDEGGRPSVSHTINGHSVAFRLRYGNVRFNMTGDLNRDAMDLMMKNLDPALLEAEIIKAPHHGSHDFDFAALEASRPIAAIVSSGDESTRKEHIHPRATLMSALGKVMRGKTGVVFCTELAAFFAQKGYSYSGKDLADYFGADERKEKSFTGAELKKIFSGNLRDDAPPVFYGFERTNFGIIHIRTDGHRVLVFTHSGKKGMNEAYSFTVDEDHKVQFQAKVTTAS